MTRRERAYNRKVQELIDKVGKLEDREVGKALKILEDARKEVAANIAQTEWQAYAIPQHRAAVEQAIERFQQQYMSNQSGALRDGWNAGIDMVDAPLQYVGIRIAAQEISMSALEIAQGYSADLIKGLSADALKKVNGEIILGITGGKSPFEVMQAIGRNLEDKGVFKSIGHRAETITRTEMARVNSSAREARIQGTVGNTEPEMKWEKKWISSGKAEARHHHAGLDGVRVGIDEDFLGYIPYPHAPGLPAEETVNCG